MSRLPVLGVICLLLPGCGATLPRAALWDDIEALQRSADRQAAERRLMAGGHEGLTGLLLAARTLGDERALKLVADPHGDNHPFHTPVPHELRETSAARAIRLARDWLVREPGLAVELAGSADWFDRALAVISQAGQPAGLVAVATALGPERQPEVNQLLIDTLETTLGRAGAKDGTRQALRERLQALQTAEDWDDDRCRSDAAGLADLAARVLAGELKKGTLSSKENVLRVHLRRPDGRDETLGPGCVLALYRALAEKDAHHPELIVPLLHWGVVSEPLKRQAVALVKADLDLIPPDQRNLAMARIINAGGQVPGRIQPVKKVLGFEVAEILEALARQDPEAARSHLERFWLCSEVFGNAKLIALSGFSADPNAAAEAYRIGQHCEHGLEPAIIALFHLGDPRAVELLDRRLNKDFPPIPAEVVYALREHRTEGLINHLIKRAAGGNEQAERILATW